MRETETVSLCPHCLRRLPARRIDENGVVYLHRRCPEHGEIEKILLWSSSAVSYSHWRRPLGEEPPDSTAPGNSPDCPFACGLCSSHRQSTCSVIIEVTRRCNLHCPVCFAGSETNGHRDASLRHIERKLHVAMEQSGPCPLQLSGGEPTLHEDLPRIVRRAREIGFDHVQINTNGVRLAEDPDYAKALRDAGVTDFFLQFDGVSDAPYRRLRGAPLLEQKIQALERCRDMATAAILVPTLARGINDSDIGAIIAFAKKWIPVVKGVHFQPVTYLGRYPKAPSNEDRLTIPDILAAIEQQTAGELCIANFIPPG